MQCPRCQQGNPSHAKFCLGCGTPIVGYASAKPYADLKDDNEQLRRSLAEALEQETATAEIRRMISQSPTDVQPVFDAIVQSATRLCDAAWGAAFRFDGRLQTFTAGCNVTASELEVLRREFPRPLTRDRATGRAIADRRVVHVADLQEDPEFAGAPLRAVGFRSVLAVPMLRDGEPIGVLGLWRREVRPFTEKQITLVSIFADQAVIAIENVRLFKELEARNRDLTTALEQQTATADVLRIIARSPTVLQPVLDAIASSATHLCRAYDSALFLLDGQSLRLVAHDGPIPSITQISVVPGTVGGRSVLERRPVHVADVQAEVEAFPEASANARHFGFRTILSVPLLREGQAIGTLQLRRTEVAPFSDPQIALLQTFADQAVIAIENVRLFTELQEKNRALTEALEQQTATSEILRVISSSPTNLEPVAQVIADSASRLCDCTFVGVFRFDGKLIHWVAARGTSIQQEEALRAVWPRRADSETLTGRTILGRQTLHLHDAEADRGYGTFNLAARAALAMRSFLGVPMLREGQPIGAITLARSQVNPFSEREISLIQTFADQAVIAIENVRLFTELQARTGELTQSVDELTALGEVSRALSSTLDLETVLQTIVSRAVQIAGTADCTIWEYDEPRAEFRLRASHYADQEDAAVLQAPSRVTTIPKGQGVTTQVMERRQPVQIHDITTARDYESPIRRPLVEAGHRALLGVPLLSEDEVIGVLTVTRKTPGEFEPQVVRLLSTFATQSALAIQNARLFLEIEDKSRQLEAASQHKSEFLANMSHELRTPLNAIIGFSEVLLERMFGEVNEKQVEYLQDILESGRHLLSLINDILDLSKIEAGRMELEVTDFDLPQAIANAVMLVRERAERHGITLSRVVDQHLGQIRGDERKIRQVLLNLLSNAIKFTPEGGRIEVRAVSVDGSVEVSVADTGVGIAPDDQEAVFEEFRQVGTADKKVEGTGLGLTLCRKFVELHGGKIWVKSQVGVGSTFTFTIPVRRGE